MMLTRAALWIASIYFITGEFEFNTLPFWAMIGLIWASGLLGRIEGLELGRLECRALLQIAQSNLQRAIMNFQEISGLEVPKPEKKEKQDGQV